jgi:hypothetical protein
MMLRAALLANRDSGCAQSHQIWTNSTASTNMIAAIANRTNTLRAIRSETAVGFTGKVIEHAPVQQRIVASWLGDEVAETP